MSGSDIKAGGAFVELYMKDENVAKGLGRLQQSADSFTKNLGDMNRFAGALGATVGIVGAFRLGAAGAGVAVANTNSELARMNGLALDIYKAQLKQIDAWGQMFDQIPVIGQAMQNIYNLWSDRKGTEAAIKNIEDIQSAIKTMEEKAREWHRETVLQNAKTGGAGEAELLRIKTQFEADDRKTTLDGLRDQVNKAKGMEEEARDKAKPVTQRLDASKAELERGRGIVEARKGQGFEREDAAWIAGMERRIAGQKKEAQPLLDNIDALKAQREKAEKAYADAIEASKAKDQADLTAAGAMESEAILKAGEERAAAESRISQAVGSESERRIAQVKAEYAELVKLAQKYGLDTTALNTAMSERIASIQNEPIEKAKREQEQMQADLERIRSSVNLRGERQAEQRRRSALLEQDPQAAATTFKQELTNAQTAATQTWNNLRTLQQDIWKDGLMSDEERAAYESLKDDLESAAGRVLDAQTWVDRAAGAMDKAQKEFDVTGTFSTSATFGLGAGGAMDRIASASEKTEKHTKDIAQSAKSGGLTFG